MIKYKLAASKNLNYEKNSTFSLSLKRTQQGFLLSEGVGERKEEKKKSLTFFLFLCLVLAESCPAFPFPRDPAVAFPACCGPEDGAVGVGGGVFSGESG